MDARNDTSSGCQTERTVFPDRTEFAPARTASAAAGTDPRKRRACQFRRRPSVVGSSATVFPSADWTKTSEHAGRPWGAGAVT